MHKSIIVLIDGVQGSGKSTLARNLAGKVDRGVCLDADWVRTLIIGGRVGPDDNQKEEFLKQRILAVENIAFMAQNFQKNGFHCFISDLIHLEEVLKEYERWFKNIQNSSKILLTTKVETAISRDSSRVGVKKRGSEDIKRMQVRMGLLDKQDWIQVDNTNMTADETTDFVIKKLQIS